MKETKILLSEKELPQKWYNIQADLPKPKESFLLLKQPML